MRRLSLLFVALLTLSCLTLASAQSRAPEPQKKTLPNGLTVLVQENHAAPVVAVRVYVRTGSIYEGRYLGAGISHLFEHVLGEGTKTMTKKQIADEIQSIGGQYNAYTTNDVTAYHITTAAPYFNRALNILADQMQNATFPEAEVKIQQGIIHNEMNLDTDDPGRELWRIFDATAFQVHPVRVPVIGYPEAFDRLTREDIVNYYNSHYTPENSVLAVAGDVQADDVFAAAEKAFATWERSTASIPAIPDEPRQVSQRRAVIEKDVQLDYLLMGWHTVPLQHPDLYALDVLATILGDGDSSRLVRQLREEKNLVSSISAFSQTPNYNAGIFGVSATLPPANREKVEKAIWAAIEDVQQHGVTPSEVERAQSQMESSYIFGNSDVAEQAERIAMDYIGTGDPTFSSHYVERIKQVTPEQVRAVARKYLLREGTTTALIEPLSKTSAVAQQQATPQAEAPLAHMMTMRNGMRVIIREDHATPTVAIVVTGLGGARLEPANRAGIANLAAEMLTRGTRRRTAEQIAQTVDAMGADMDAFSGYNSWGIASRWLARDWRRGLTMVSESVLSPTFPATELARVKQQVAAGIRQQQDDPERLASLLLRKAYYGSHPYGRSTLGSLDTIKSITPSDVKSYWNHILRPKWTVLSIYGDIDPKQVQSVVKYLFGDFKSEELIPAAPALPAPPSKASEATETKPGIAQTILFYGFPGASINDSDRYALEVMNGALAGLEYPGGRLFARLRDNQLVYAVSAFMQPGIGTGMFDVYAATTPPNRAKVQAILAEEFKRMRETDITPEELTRAKSMAIAAAAIDRQSNLAQARGAASDELFGLGYADIEQFEQRINAVTIEDVRRVAEKYLRPDIQTVAVVEPAATP